MIHITSILCNHLNCIHIDNDGFCNKDYVVFDDVKDLQNGALTTIYGKCRFYKNRDDTNDL